MRYVVPLREGGSLPGVIAGDDGALWVGKFRGAGQGAAALAAEVIAGELARAAGLRVPELVVLALAKGFGATEGDGEIHDLLLASEGDNLGVAFLTGALGFDPACDRIAPELAAKVVGFDVLVSNVDRTVRNPNILVVAGEPWFIDHGAALYWQHAWDGGVAGADAPLPRVAEHVLLPIAGDLGRAATELAAALSDAKLAGAVEATPDAWLAAPRAAYVARLALRRDALARIVAGVPRG